MFVRVCTLYIADEIFFGCIFTGSRNSVAIVAALFRSIDKFERVGVSELSLNLDELCGPSFIVIFLEGNKFTFYVLARNLCEKNSLFMKIYLNAENSEPT